MNKPTESYQTSPFPVPFLRLETPRARLALPYATLLGINLATDGNSLQMDFAAHQVTVHGKYLYEVYCSISAGLCAVLVAHGESQEMKAGPDNQAPVIRDIRIKPRGETS
jgi:hypothetical protein